MLINSIEELGLKLISLAAAIWGSEKLNIMNKIFNPGDSQEVMALKMSAFLSASEYVGSYALERVLGRSTRKQYVDMTSFSYAFLSNAIVLYAFDKMKLDEKIITSSSQETRAVQMAALFVLVQELSYYLLGYVMKTFY